MKYLISTPAEKKSIRLERKTEQARTLLFCSNRTKALAVFPETADPG
jgi:hypothetical protein